MAADLAQPDPAVEVLTYSRRPTPRQTDFLAEMAVDYLSEVDAAAFEDWIATVRCQRLRRIDERAGARSSASRGAGGRR